MGSQRSPQFYTSLKTHTTQIEANKMAMLLTPPSKAFQFPPFPKIPQKHNSTHCSSNRESRHNGFKNGFLSKSKDANMKRVVPIVRAASDPHGKDSRFGRILLSDVVVKRKRNVFWGRKWNYLDVATVGVVIAVHLLCVFAPFKFNRNAFWVAVGLYVITGLLGVTLSFHRNLSHRSFKLPKWLEYLFAYCGVQALQGNPIDWVSTHRYHHQFCDSEKDPHSPIEGFWFSHMSWLFDKKTRLERCGEPNNVGDLEKQHFYKFLESTYIIHPMALGALLYALGGFPYIVWGMAWNTGDLSRNNWWVGVLAFGEGWHNNHHAFEYSARHGLEWWQIDMTWYVVRLLQAIGLATDVKLPNTAHKQRMAFSNSSP